MSFDVKRMIKFEHNIGSKEKQYRLYAGVAALAVAIFSGSIPLLLIGLLLAGTGFSGWCPAYSGLGKNTCEAGAASDASATNTDENAH